MRPLFLLLFVLLPWRAAAGEFPAQAHAEALPNGRALSGTLLSSGQPDAGELQALAGAGLAAVINLRATGEDPGFDQAAVLQGADVAYYRIPVAGSGGLTRANAERLDRLLARHAGQPVLVHCASGNRVGALFALRAHWLQGADRATAIGQGRAAGMTGLESAVQGLLADD